MEVGQSNKKVIAIIQGRLGSKRLPEKVLLPLPIEGEDPILGIIINAIKKSKLVDEIVVATSENEVNNAIENYANKIDIECYRGSEENVYSRFKNIISSRDSDVVVRITADNPFLDVDLLDLALEDHIIKGVDYTITKGLPTGMNFEIINADCFRSTSDNNLTQDEKEHVTMYFRNSNNFSSQEYFFADYKEISALRVTVDYIEDYSLASLLFSLWNDKYKGSSCIEFIKETNRLKPWLFKLNEKNYQVKQFTDRMEEVAYSIDILNTMQLPFSANLLQKYIQDEK